MNGLVETVNINVEGNRMAVTGLGKALILVAGHADVTGLGKRGTDKDQQKNSRNQNRMAVAGVVWKTRIFPSSG